jgi:hypothetical protein
LTETNLDRGKEEKRYYDFVPQKLLHKLGSLHQGMDLNKQTNKQNIIISINIIYDKAIMTTSKQQGRLNNRPLSRVRIWREGCSKI